jgi:hypothetical protein
MIKYKIDNVAKDSKNDGHVVYVKLYDDKNPDVILAGVCVPFSTQEAFEAVLEAKTIKYLDSVSSRDAVRELAEQSIIKTEGKIAIAEVIK